MRSLINFIVMFIWELGYMVPSLSSDYDFVKPHGSKTSRKSMVKGELQKGGL
jgi:hypothetical protein